MRRGSGSPESSHSPVSATDTHSSEPLVTPLASNTGNPRVLGACPGPYRGDLATNSLHMNSNSPTFRQPTALERAFNRIFGFLVGLGLGFSYNYLLEVRGRKSGKLYSTPIDLLKLNGKTYLVAPRGRTQWVRRRSCRRSHAEEGEHAPEIPPAPNCRRRQAANLEGLPRLLQARSAALLPDSRRLACRIIRRTRWKLSSIRTSCRLICLGRSPENNLRKSVFPLAQN